MFVRIAGRRAGYDLTEARTHGQPVVVFVHGLASSRSIWTGISERLERAGYGTLRYDLRGHGESDPVDASCSRSDLAKDLAGLLAVLAIDRTIIVGHSAGGVIAMQMAADHPNLVAGLVLVGTASECNERTAQWYASTADLARDEGGQAAMRAMGVRSKDATIPDGTTFAHVALAMASLHQDPLTAPLTRFAQPSLIVVGEKDFLGAGGSVILSRTIAGSELEIRPGRGHAVHLEDEDWFASRVVEFLTNRVSDSRP